MPIRRAIQLPPPSMRRLNPAEVGRLMKRARKLGRRGELTPHDHRLLDALLFQCGNPTSGAVVVSYSALARITAMARATIAKGIARLVGCGLLQKIKRRLRVTWHQGGTASLQAPNAYGFNVPGPADTESAPQAVIQKLEILSVVATDSADAEDARRRLTEVREKRAAAEMEKRRTKVAAALAAGQYIAR